MKIILFILFFSTLNSIFGQTEINLSVTNRSNSESIYAAKIIVSSKEYLKTVCTDFDGKITVKIPLTDSVQIIIKEKGFKFLDSSFAVSSKLMNVSIALIPERNSDFIVDFNTYNRKRAVNDIEKKNIEILLPGGIVSSAIFPNDSNFEKKYNVKFASQGCTRNPGDNESEYNQEIFKFLDQKFGKEWRDEIRQDAIGLKRK